MTRSLSVCEIKAAALVDLEAFCSVRRDRGGATQAEIVDSCEHELRLPNYGVDRVVFLAWIDGEAVGYGRAMRYDLARDGNLYSTTQPLPEGWYLRGVVAKSGFRRLGVAQALTEHRLNWLEQRAREIFCFLDSDEKLTVPMYQALGFLPSAGEWGFLVPGMENETGILLRRPTNR